jgi:hypothetical protein
MNQHSVSKKFVFNEKIDNEFIFNLYEDDYAYITEVFTTSLETFDEDVARVQEAYDANDLQSLGKAVHKIKPVFGFTGLIQHQEKIVQFEKVCLNAPDTSNIRNEYTAMMDVMSDGKAIMEQELHRLTAFTA